MKILIAAGGTGGHLSPAFALAQEVIYEKPTSKILFVTSKKKSDVEAVKKRNLEFRSIDVVALQCSHKFKNVFSFAKLFLGFLKSLLLILGFKPDIVIGFGGYVSVPVMLAAFVLKRRTIIHEQNVKPGLANSFLSYFADKFAISFKKTEDFIRRKDLVLTGNPLRREIFNIDKISALKRFNFSSDKFHILVIGGSQGSHSINMLTVGALSIMDSSVKNKMEFIHITGKNDYNQILESYKRSGVSANVFPYLDDIGYAYAASDLVIARAGATTISEILSFNLPSILIPYPYARAHQILNAKVLEEGGCCVLRDEKEISPEIFKSILLEFYSNRGILSNMTENCRRLFTGGSARNLANLVIHSLPVESRVR
jgi:UDP-N-acetylglucosamine--N-acetylmuramyl-(pentapeptide) pyrophosphoryl-undecaprenol N-acetylglucosamine transferase